jgi:hypothetical protein
MKTYVVALLSLAICLPVLAQDLLSDAALEQPNVFSAPTPKDKSIKTKKESVHYFVLLSSNNELNQSIPFDLELSPNPLRSGVLVKQPEFEVLKAIIYDTTGTQIQMYTIDRGTHWLDFSAFYSESYSICFTDSKGEVSQTFTLTKINP